MPVHTVRQGECILSIADHYGHHPDDIWEHADNAQLRETRDSPAMLKPGDALLVPDIESQTIHSASGKEHVFRCERVLEDGEEVVEIKTPCLLTASNEINNPRLPSVKGILMASRKQIPIWGTDEVGVDAAMVGAAGLTLELTRLYKPDLSGNCEFIEADSLEEAADKLGDRLREDKII